MQRTKLEHIIFTLLVGAVFAGLALNALSFPAKAQLFPLVVGIVAVVLVILDLILAFVQKRSPEGNGITGQAIKVLPYLLWILALYVGIYLFGFVIASGLFVFSFLLREAKMNLFVALIATAVVVGFIYSLGNILSLEWPFGLISDWFGIEL